MEPARTRLYSLLQRPIDRDLEAHRQAESAFSITIAARSSPSSTRRSRTGSGTAPVVRVSSAASCASIPFMDFSISCAIRSVMSVQRLGALTWLSPVGSRRLRATSRLPGILAAAISGRGSRVTIAMGDAKVVSIFRVPGVMLPRWEEMHLGAESPTSPCMRCLYCPDELGPDNRSFAHVFPNGIGGRLRSDGICCHSCNNSFTEIESQCLRALAPVGAMMKARRGDGQPIETVFDHDGRRFRVSNGGMFEEAPPPSDKGRKWELPADESRQVTQVVTMLQQRRMPPEAIIDGTLLLVDAPPAPTPGGLSHPELGVTVNMEWDYPAARRLQFKIACDLVAYSMPDVARSDRLRPAVEFARHGVGDYRVAFDASTQGTRLPEVAAPYRHVIEVWTHGTCVHTRIGLFTELRFVGTLTSSWDGPQFRSSYSFNCVDPKDTRVERDAGDGDFVVKRSARLAHAELLEASARLSDTMRILTTDVQAYRAEALTVDELYRRIKPTFDSTPWPIK